MTEELINTFLDLFLHGYDKKLLIVRYEHLTEIANMVNNLNQTKVDHDAWTFSRLCSIRKKA